MAAKLPPLPEKAAAPGAIPDNQRTLHRAAHALLFSSAHAGSRTLTSSKRADRILDVRDKVRSHVANQEAADDVIRRVIGKVKNGRDPSTRRTEYVILIVPAADKAAAAELVAEALCGPLRLVGWQETYDSRMSDERKTFDHGPLISVAVDDTTITHYRATLRMTADQHADLLTLIEEATPAVELTMIDLDALNEEASQRQIVDALEIRGLAPLAGDS